MNPRSHAAVLPRTDRNELVEAALSLFREQGLSGVTQRAVAERAGVPAATLQHRFGSKDELLRDTFAALAAAAIAAIDRDAAALGTPPTTPDESAQLFTAVAGGPLLAAADTPALLEMLTQAVRDEGARPAARAWTDRLQAHWQAAVAAWSVELGDAGWLLTELQVGLALVSVGAGNRLAAALANRDVAEWVFYGPVELAGPWFRRFLAEATARPAPSLGPGRVALHPKLAEAGAEIVARQGPTALSFRSVAEAAGVSLSAVTHHFPRRDVLLYAVYRHLHDALARQAEATATGQPEWRSTQPAVEMVLNARIAGAPMFLASAELCLAAAREPTLGDMAWMMRMTRGLYQYRRGDPAFDPAGRAAFLSHIRSIWMTGCALVHAARDGEAGLAAVLGERFRAGLDLTERGLASTAR
jgi:AcrR family transcriptional regulator